MTCGKLRLLGARANSGKLARDTIRPHTNKRFLSKREVVQQLAQERQPRQNAEKRECYWKDKYNPSALKS